MFGQDPISTPYVVDLTPCRTATLTVPQHPSDWIIDRNPATNELKYMADTYLSSWSNSQN